MCLSRTSYLLNSSPLYPVTQSFVHPRLKKNHLERDELRKFSSFIEVEEGVVKSRTVRGLILLWKIIALRFEIFSKRPILGEIEAVILEVLIGLEDFMSHCKRQVLGDEQPCA
jgi:hypothetical protein